MSDNRMTELVRELRDLACDINAAEISDHMHIAHGMWMFDTQWLDSWHNAFDRIADKVEQESIYAWNTRAERTTSMYRDKHGIWHCENCEHGADRLTGSDGALDAWEDSWAPNYCPNCGAKVVDR